MDDKGRVSAKTTLTMKPLAGNEVTKQLKEVLAGREVVLFLNQPLKKISAAKTAVAEKKAALEDHFVLLLHLASGQQWTRAVEQLEQCEKLAAGKPGLAWLRREFLHISRRHEELRQRLLEEAGRLAKAEPRMPDELIRVGHLLAQARNMLEANEQLVLLDQLRPVYARQPAHRFNMKLWAQMRLTALQQTGEAEDVLGLQKQLATDWPDDAGLQQQYAQGLANAGDYPAAYAWLQRVLADESRWEASEAKNSCSARRLTRIPGPLGRPGRLPRCLDLQGSPISRPRGPST